MAARPHLSGYPHVADLQTRWMDNDVYGHVNNVTYYSYFDTAANTYLIEHGGLDIERSAVIGLVVESGCSYHAPVAFPHRLRTGLRVDVLGNRAVTYGIAIFTAESDDAVAHGHLVHVFVDRESRSAVRIPAQIRQALTRLADR
ncbi:thioesterase family protein [soil metagenome]